MEEKKQRPILTANCCHCGFTNKFSMPEKAGIVRLKCQNPGCGKDFGVKIEEKVISMGNPSSQNENSTKKEEPLPVVTDVVYKGKTDSSRSMAHLSQERGFFRSPIFHALSLGENTIGRKDNSKPSAIMIDGDATISRRSISITVTESQGGYEYLFTLLEKPKNPVIVNVREYTAPPASFVIFPGAKIMLGKTKLTLTY